MTTFPSFMDQLPDPNYRIDTAGASNSSGNPGPGFAKIKFSSNNQIQVARTLSGRGITASPGYHMWEFSINYNPITRAEFEPVATFLEQRRGRLYPFYVVLPQHAKPQNVTFATYCQTNTILVSGAHNSGVSRLTIALGNTNDTITNHPSPGDFFTITDSGDTLHKKVYKIVRVETSSYYQQDSTPVVAGTRRLHIVPPLTRATSDGSIVNFINPKFRVIQKSDTIEYDLDTDNLYQFSLNLEEILP